MALLFGFVFVLLRDTLAQETYSPLILCENKDPVYIKCNTSIDILSAVYGRTDNSICLPVVRRRTTHCLSNTSYSIVNNSCTGKQQCKVNADNSVYGDPCDGTYKYLNVTYKCADFQSVTTDDSKETPLTISIAIGISFTLVLALSLTAVVLFLRRRSKLTGDKERIVSEKDFDDLENPNTEMPDTGRSIGYTELNTRVNSFNYQDLELKPKTLETSYDYIDTSHNIMSFKRKEIFVGEENKKVKNQLPNVLKNNLSLVPDDPVLVANNHKTLVFGKDYVVLDPNETGFDRSRKTLNELMENENNCFLKQTADIFPYDRNYSQIETDYNTTNAQNRNQSSNNIYSHIAGDNVYDTTTHERKEFEGPSDNTYDHSFGNKTE